MKVLLLLISLAVVLGQPQRHGSRHASTYPDRYYPGGGYYPDRYYPDSGNPYVRPTGCKNWCRRENYYPGRQQYYCCDHSGPVVYPRPPVPYPYPYPPHQQKICPASPAVCTRVFSSHGAPTECYGDSECHTSELCCYDVCLKHNTCKTADYVEGAHRPVRPVRPPYRPRPRPGGLLTGIVGSLFARSNFDAPHADDASSNDGHGASLRAAKDVKDKKKE